MSKKSGLILISGLIIFTLIFFLVSTNKKEAPTTIKGDLQLSAISPTPNISLKMKEYIDPSGFKFSYPDNLKLEKKTPSKTQTYSLLEISSSSYSGKITFDVTGSNFQSIDEWFKDKKDIKTSGVKKIKLGDVEARQYELNKNIVTIAFDNGVLFTIVANLQDQRVLWNTVNNQIVSSFAFVAPPADSSATPSSDSSSSYSDDLEYEGEEIIE